MSYKKYRRSVHGMTSRVIRFRITFMWEPRVTCLICWGKFVLRVNAHIG